MGFYEIGKPTNLPIGAACWSDGCPATHEPTKPTRDRNVLFASMLDAGWGFDAFAGRNLPSCPKHTSSNDRRNLTRIVGGPLRDLDETQGDKPGVELGA